MNWLARKVVDGYRALVHKIYARRYGTLAQHMGREQITSPSEDKVARGLIIIQIDGLAYDHLVQAIAQGAAPHIKRLIGTGQLRLAPWHCGLPSTTPAVQAGIMFGNNWDIPGFRWYDKAQQRAFVCKRPTTLQVLQKQVAGERPGILCGGASYYNMFDGDAEWAVFTLSAMRVIRFFEGVRGLGLSLLFLFSPLRVLRVIGRALWNYLLDLWRRLLALFRPSVYRPFDLLSPMTHIFTQVLFQEMITFGVQLDIYRGAPAVYANLTNYDEIAHHVGPSHSAAFKAIKNMDRQIGRIDKTLKRYPGREYDLYILSDHGMSPSVSFKERFGLSLGDYIAQQIDEPLTLDERYGAPSNALKQAHYLLEELHGLEERLSPRGAAVVRTTREYLSRHVLPAYIEEHQDMLTWPLDATEHDTALLADEDENHWDPEHHSDVTVRVSGSLAHIYLNVSEKRLNLSEIALLYPTLLTRLIEHPGIGLVIGHEGNETVMMNRHGTLTTQDVLEQLHGSNPLAGLGDRHAQATRINRLASFPHSGDLILLGAWTQEHVITFENQIGTHGGLGGLQEKPFILYPANVDWPNRPIQDPCELYEHFIRYTHPQTSPHQPTATDPQAASIKTDKLSHPDNGQIAYTPESTREKPF